MRWSPKFMLLLAVAIMSSGAGRCQPPAPPGDAFETLRREVGDDPLALGQAVREKLAAATDDLTREALTGGWARLLIVEADRPDEGVEALRLAEEWATPDVVDRILRETYRMVMERAIAAKALAATEKALQLHPESRALWVSAARLKAWPGDHEGALEAWTKAQAIASTPYGLRGLSRTYRQLERWDEAVGVARTIPDLSVVEQAQYIAEPLQKLGRADEVLKLAEGLAKRTDLTSADLRALAGIYAIGERLDAAESVLAKAIEMAGDNAADVARARYSLASVLEAKQDLAGASEQYLLAAEGGLDNAQHWVARHLVDGLGDPAGVDRMLKACVIAGAVGGTFAVSPSWFDDLPGLPDEARHLLVFSL